ncbi:Zinc finger protein ZAT4, partial [Cucurbita argyrosperma subsp. sororia]
MENSKENKFVCNFCHKSFTCGKSLGGHIRIHKNEKQTERTNILKFQVPTERRRSKRDSESEFANDNSGYGLRENPKITQRFADSRYPLMQEKFCRECGKGFQSSEALTWHLASHSQNNIYGIPHQKREFIDNRSDIPDKVREAAMCLMMMSDSKSFASHSNERLEKLDVYECGGENSDTENFRQEVYKRVKLKVCLNRGVMDEEYKNPDGKYGVRIGKTKENDEQVHASSYKYELRKRLNNESYSPNFRETYTKMSNGCEWTHQSGENSVTNSMSIPARELTELSNGKNKAHQDSSGNEEKKLGAKKKHKCPICFKAFKSGQALGGHKRSHVVGSLEEASIVTRPESNGMSGLIDLNVPAPMEEEESGRWGEG